MPDLTPQHAAERIGHKGADLIAPGNTLASFDAALEAGVDMVEFDVLPERPRRLRRGWCSPTTTATSRAATALTLEEGLAHFAQDAWAGVELDVDLKLAGYERRVVEALREHGLVERALISTMEEASLAGRARSRPRIRLGWSVPKIRRNPLEPPDPRCPRWSLAARTPGACSPARARDAIRDGAHRRADVPLGARDRRALVRAIDDAGGELYVVDGRRRRRGSRRSSASGVTASSRTTRGCSAGAAA